MRWLYKVHPRVRGERKGVLTQLDVQDGSSPHVRGTRCAWPFGRVAKSGSSPHARGTLYGEQKITIPNSGRFIPACAGNATFRELRTTKQIAVHPRMCGERSGTAAQYSTSGGSSPHARGTRVEDWPRCGHARAVHPRVRGERMDRHC